MKTIKVVPAIIPKSFDELNDKIDIVSDFVDTIQIDISDGEFAENITWPYTEGDELPNHELPQSDTLKLELDLYANNPDEVIDAWIEAGVKTVILHLETIDNPSVLIADLKLRDIEIGISINPSTRSSILDQWIPEINFVQLMGTAHCMGPWGPMGPLTSVTGISRGTHIRGSSRH